MQNRILVAPLLLLAACSSSGGDIQDEEIGAISLEVAAGPSDAACLRVTVAGAGEVLAVRNLRLTAGVATTASLSGLPVGAVTVRGQAYSTGCSAVTSSSVPTWLTPPTSATLVPGTPVPVLLTMQRPGELSVSVDWATGGSLGAVAAPLDGFMYTAPCLSDSDLTVCTDRVGSCPVANADPVLSGHLATNTTVTLGGTSGVQYTITLHVQGVVEAKAYTGGTDANTTLASPNANGFRTGGTPSSGDAYQVYALRVTNPGAAATTYYLNSLVPPGVSSRTTYGVDYTATIQAQGGASVRLIASDPNCSMIKNCGPAAGQSTCLAPITPANIEATTVAHNPTFNFASPYNGQWLALTVTNVTSP